MSETLFGERSMRQRKEKSLEPNGPERRNAQACKA
jgi:hypothetical protein